MDRVCLPPAVSVPINCRVPGAVVAPLVVRLEIGHALGFWHTDSAADVMWGGTWSNPGLTPSPRELAVAAVVYSRPAGTSIPIATRTALSGWPRSPCGEPRA